MSKLIVGIITYEDFTAKYLPYFLQCLKEQTFQNFELVIFDNSEKDFEKNAVVLQKYYPNIKPQGAEKNLGFARAYNFLIREAFDRKSEYFLITNPDVIFEPDALAKMVKALDDDATLGSVCPKLKHWDFDNNVKTNIIDSCGIKLLPGLRFYDIGAGDEDKGQYDNIEILGPSGAGGMYRLSALDKIKNNNMYFDEMMFMYKEDCDLAYRLHLAGFKSKCIAAAVGYHHRTIAGAGESNAKIAFNRRAKSRQVKKWSYLNQQIIFSKFWHLQSFNNKLAIIWYQIKMFVFILFFEPYLLGQLVELSKLKKKIKGVY